MDDKDLNEMEDVASLLISQLLQYIQKEAIILWSEGRFLFLKSLKIKL